MAISAYIAAVSLPFCFSLIAETFTLFLSLWFTTTLYAAKASKIRLLITALIVVLIRLTCMYGVNYFTFPEAPTIFWHSVFLFALPLLMFVFYPLLQFFVKIPKHICTTVTKKVMLYMNISICVFLLAQESLLHQGEWTSILSLDQWALFISVLFTTGFFAVSFFILYKMKFFIHLPSGQALPRHRLSLSFLQLLAIYALLIVFRQLFVQSPATTPYSVEAEPFHLVSYIILILALTTYIIIVTYWDISYCRKSEIESMRKHIELLKSAHEEYRGIKHDIGNMLQVYDGYLAIGDLDMLREYHRSVFKSAAGAALKVDLARTLGEYPPLYSLLLLKEEQAFENGVGFQITRQARLDPGIPVSNVDLCRILGILYDNAIEAAAESSEKRVRAACERVSSGSEEEPDIIFAISNTCDTSINLTQIFEEGTTTKGTDRGFGLYEARKLIQKNRPLSLFATQEEGWVTFYLTVVYAE